MVALRKQARPNLTVGGEAHAAAMPAEGSPDRRNNPDLTQAVVEGKALCRLTYGVRRKLHQGAIRVQPCDDFIHRNDGLGLPAPVFLKRHEFDEADDDAFAPG